MHTTQEVIPEPKVLTEAGLVCLGEPSYPRVDIQETSVPLGKEIL